MNQNKENAKLNWQQQVKENSNFCILPFIHAHLGTTGDVNLCCVAENSPEEWKGGNKNLHDVWQGEYYQKMRQSFLEGKRVPHCRRCWEADDSGGGSDRQTHNNWFNPSPDFALDVVQGNNTGKPTFLDLRPGNFCNLACRMCFTRVSSKINDQHKEHPEMEKVTGESYWHEVNDWIDDPDRFDEIKSWIPTTKTLKLAGGEPLFMPGVIKLLRWCVDNGHTHMHLDITTNGTCTKGKILNWIEQFDSVDIQLSIDGIGSTNNYIRNGSDWVIIDEAYKKYLSMNFRVNLLATVQIYNAYDLVNIVEYWKKLGANGNLIFNFVDWPQDLQIDIMPEEDRLFIARRLERAVEDIHPDKRQQFRMDATIERLRNPRVKLEELDALRGRWVIRTKMMDRINNYDLSNVHQRLVLLRNIWQK